MPKWGYIPDPTDIEGILLRDDNLHKQRFHNFRTFYKSVSNSKFYPPDYDKQGIIHLYPNDQMLFLALNSCWEIDYYYPMRASINMDALNHALNQLMDKKYNKWLKIAVCHHPVLGLEAMKNVNFLQRLADLGFQIFLHGHIHDSIENYHKYDQNNDLFIIGAGALGTPTREIVTGIPLQYNLMTLDLITNKLSIKSRKKEKPDGAWAADARWGDKNNPKSEYNYNLNIKNYDNRE